MPRLPQLILAVLTSALLAQAAAASDLSDAQQAMDAGNYEQAVELFRLHLADQQAPSYEVLYGYARALAFAGRHQEALDAYNQVLESFPHDPDALVGRGRVYAWLEQGAEAEADFNAVLVAHPDNLDAWVALADLYRWQKKADQEAFFEGWLAHFADKPEPYLAQARYLMSQRRFPQAREALLKARTLGLTGPESDKLLAQINRQPGVLNWESLIQYDFQAFGPASATQTAVQPWHTLTAGIGRYFDWGFLSLQGSGTQRFGLWDQSLTLDSYVDLWSGGYGNFRVSGTWDPEVVPRWDVFGELYQSLFEIFELSGGYRLMAFNADNVNFFHLGFGTYLGNWYFGLQPMLLLSGQGPGAQLGSWVRYVFNTSDDYIDLRLGIGRRIATVGAPAESGQGPQLQGQSSFYGVLTGQYFITPQVGLIASLNYNYDDQFPSRFGFTLGNKLRW